MFSKQNIQCLENLLETSTRAKILRVIRYCVKLLFLENLSGYYYISLQDMTGQILLLATVLFCLLLRKIAYKFTSEPH